MKNLKIMSPAFYLLPILLFSSCNSSTNTPTSSDNQQQALPLGWDLQFTVGQDSAYTDNQVQILKSSVSDNLYSYKNLKTQNTIDSINRAGLMAFKVDGKAITEKMTYKIKNDNGQVLFEGARPAGRYWNSMFFQSPKDTKKFTVELSYKGQVGSASFTLADETIFPAPNLKFAGLSYVNAHIGWEAVKDAQGYLLSIIDKQNTVRKLWGTNKLSTLYTFSNNNYLSIGETYTVVLSASTWQSHASVEEPYPVVFPKSIANSSSSLEIIAKIPPSIDISNAREHFFGQLNDEAEVTIPIKNTGSMSLVYSAEEKNINPILQEKDSSGLLEYSQSENIYFNFSCKTLGVFETKILIYSNDPWKNQIEKDVTIECLKKVKFDLENLWSTGSEHTAYIFDTQIYNNEMMVLDESGKISIWDLSTGVRKTAYQGPSYSGSGCKASFKHKIHICPVYNPDNQHYSIKLINFIDNTIVDSIDLSTRYEVLIAGVNDDIFGISYRDDYDYIHFDAYDFNLLKTHQIVKSIDNPAINNKYFLMMGNQVLYIESGERVAVYKIEETQAYSTVNGGFYNLKARDVSFFDENKKIILKNIYPEAYDLSTGKSIYIAAEGFTMPTRYSIAQNEGVIFTDIYNPLSSAGKSIVSSLYTGKNLAEIKIPDFGIFRVFNNSGETLILTQAGYNEISVNTLK